MIYFSDIPTLCQFTELADDEIKVGWPVEAKMVHFKRKYVVNSPSQRILPTITASVGSHALPVVCQDDLTCSFEVTGEYFKQNEQVTITTSVDDSEVTCESYIALRYEGRFQSGLMDSCKHSNWLNVNYVSIIIIIGNKYCK